MRYKLITGLITTQEELEKEFPWLAEASFEDAEIMVSEDACNEKYLTWENGTWLSGKWEWGTWLSGVWKDGTWINGVWKGGTWEFGYIADFDPPE